MYSNQKPYVGSLSKSRDLNESQFRGASAALAQVLVKFDAGDFQKATNSFVTTFTALDIFEAMAGKSRSMRSSR